MAYFTLVRPILEYGCAAWDPYLSQNIETLEKIQNKALWFIFRLWCRVSSTVKKWALHTIYKNQMLFFNLFGPWQLVKLGKAFKFLLVLFKKCLFCSFLFPFRQNEFLRPFALFKGCSVGIFDLIWMCWMAKIFSGALHP